MISDMFTIHSMNSNERSMSLGRRLLIWFGSFTLIALFLYLYFAVPVAGLVGAGVLTLALTFVQHFAKRSRPR